MKYLIHALILTLMLAPELSHGQSFTKDFTSGELNGSLLRGDSTLTDKLHLAPSFKSGDSESGLATVRNFKMDATQPIKVQIHVSALKLDSPYHFSVQYGDKSNPSYNGSLEFSLEELNAVKNGGILEAEIPAGTELNYMNLMLVGEDKADGWFVDMSKVVITQP